MTVLNTEVANNVIYRVLENGDANAAFPTLLTTMFTPTEILDSMNRVQQAFLLATGMIVTRTTIAANAGTPKYQMPADSIRPRRLTWQDAGGSIKVLTQVDTWELDNGKPDWPSDAGVPFSWWETTLAQQQIAIAPTPNQIGQINLLYVQLAQPSVSGIAAVVVFAGPNTLPLANYFFVVVKETALGLVAQSLEFGPLLIGGTRYGLFSNIPQDTDAVAWRIYFGLTAVAENQYFRQTRAVVAAAGFTMIINAPGLAGIVPPPILSVPDDWSPYILWGTLAELLSSDGPSFDPVRAQYCKQRYNEGVELANLVLMG